MRNGEVRVYRKKGLNDVCLDRAERFVSDDDEDLLLLLQVDEVTEPGFLGKSVQKDKKKTIKKKNRSMHAHKECLSSLHHCCANPFISPSIYPSVFCSSGEAAGSKQRIPQRK